MLDKGVQNVPIYGAVEDPVGVDPVVTEHRDEGRRAPMAEIGGPEQVIETDGNDLLLVASGAETEGTVRLLDFRNVNDGDLIFA